MARGSPPRVYFYHLAHSGLLFLDATRRKNYATALKDPVFLDHFFRRLRPRGGSGGKFDLPGIGSSPSSPVTASATTQAAGGSGSGTRDSGDTNLSKFSLVSPCAGELNFVSVGDPIAGETLVLALAPWLDVIARVLTTAGSETVLCCAVCPN